MGCRRISPALGRMAHGHVLIGP